MLDVKFKREHTIEADVKFDIKKLLTADDWFWWSTPTGTAYGRSGISDFGSLKNGVFLAIEAKKYPNKPTPPQIGYLNSVNASGGFGFVVDERRLDHLKTWLETFSRATLAASQGAKVTDEDGSTMLNMIAAMTQEL